MFVDFIEGYWIDTEKCLVKYFLFSEQIFSHIEILGEKILILKQREVDPMIEVVLN